MHSPDSFDELYTLIKVRKVPFFITFFIAVFISYAILYAVDFIPEPVTSSPADEIEPLEEIEEAQNIDEIEPLQEEVVTSAEPVKIIFDSLDNREVTVLNPTSKDVVDLDNALLKGAVRHPDSADFSSAGNIFILGHSSYLPNVMNKNFQAFNGIQKLVWGDTIRLQSEDTEYTYRVNKVFKAKASEVSVPFTPGKALLTLATCNSFGSKDDRFVIEAVLIGSEEL